MKIIHCPRRFTQHSWGGTETAILSLAKQQKSSGHEVIIFTSKALDDCPHEIIEGIEVRRFDYCYPWLGLSELAKQQMDNAGGNLFSAAMLRALLLEPNVSLIHAHAAKRLGGIVRTAAKLRAIPYVVSVHGGLYDIPTEVEQARVEERGGSVEWGKAVGAIIGSRRVFNDASAVICFSQSELKQIKQDNPDTRVEYIPNGVDSRRFMGAANQAFRQSHGIQSDAKVILNVGRIDPQKNQLLLVNSMPKILREQSNAHLMLIGHVTDSAYHNALIRRINELELQKSVTLIPGIAHDSGDIENAYLSADVFCLPSIHEPFGIVVLEAWAAGIPVVTAKVGGAAEFTQDGIDSLHSDWDAGMWANKVLAALQPETRNALVNVARSRARNEFDKTLINQRIDNLYQELAA